MESEVDESAAHVLARYEVFPHVGVGYIGVHKPETQRQLEVIMQIGVEGVPFREQSRTAADRNVIAHHGSGKHVEDVSYGVAVGGGHPYG